jgi:anti-anti-sigma factor
MVIVQDSEFRYEVVESQDAKNWKTTMIHCHGRLVNQTAGRLKDLVKPLIPEGGRIVLDFADLEYLDSSGLGALVGLKVSALRQGMVKLELVNLSPRLKDLLATTNLAQLFAN